MLGNPALTLGMVAERERVSSRYLQKLFTEAGYRPVVKSVLNNKALKVWKKRFKPGGNLVFNINDKIFGGWSKARELLDVTEATRGEWKA